MSDFSSYTFPRSRQARRCDYCAQIIPEQERHVHHFGIFEGDPCDWRMHQECYDEFYRSGETHFDYLGNARPTLIQPAVPNVPLELAISDEDAEAMR